VLKISKCVTTNQLIALYRGIESPKKNAPFDLAYPVPAHMLLSPSSKMNAFWQIADIAAIYNEKKFNCPRCSSDDYSFLKNRLLFKCKACACQFTPKSFGIFKGSKLSYSTLLKMLEHYFNGKNAHEIHLLMGLNYRTAALFVKRCDAKKHIYSDRALKVKRRRPSCAVQAAN
jgi:transposase-like protein